MGFVSRERSGIFYLVCEELEPFVSHGFIYRRPLELESLSAKELLNLLGFPKSYLPVQVHGSKIQHCEGCSDVDAENADGIIASRASGKETRLAYGIQTADCAAVSVLGDKYFELIHAGWRGVAGEIIERGTDALKKRGDQAQLAVIWPCASGMSYEVGPEMRGIIGEPSTFGFSASGKETFDIAATIRQRYQKLLGTKIEVLIYPGCTMLESRFYSYRREGARAKRNILFMQS